jgi:hypothetical protein
MPGSFSLREKDAITADRYKDSREKIVQRPMKARAKSPKRSTDGKPSPDWKLRSGAKVTASAAL